MAFLLCLYYVVGSDAAEVLGFHIDRGGKLSVRYACAS